MKPEKSIQPEKQLKQVKRIKIQTCVLFHTFERLLLSKFGRTKPKGFFKLYLIKKKLRQGLSIHVTR